MSFSSWVFAARQRLERRQSPIKLGHVQEVLAAGLGHKTFASFKQNDLKTASTAEYAVFDLRQMMERAQNLGLELRESECLRALPFNVQLLESGTMLVPSRQAWKVVDKFTRPHVSALKAKIQTQKSEMNVGVINALDGLEPLFSLDDFTQLDWVWRHRGTFKSNHASLAGFDAYVAFPRLGRHLFGPLKALTIKESRSWENCH